MQREPVKPASSPGSLPRVVCPPFDGQSLSWVFMGVNGIFWVFVVEFTPCLESNGHRGPPDCRSWRRRWPQRCTILRRSPAQTHVLYPFPPCSCCKAALRSRLLRKRRNAPSWQQCADHRTGADLRVGASSRRRGQGGGGFLPRVPPGVLGAFGLWRWTKGPFPPRADRTGGNPDLPGIAAFFFWQIGCGLARARHPVAQGQQPGIERGHIRRDDGGQRLGRGFRRQAAG